MGGLTARVAACCDTVAPRLGVDTAGAVRRIRDRLDEPVRLAVLGRLKAGKSTLVNALIGRRVAPTADGECTRVLTRYRYGTADRVEVVDVDGTRTAVPLDDDGMVPARLPVPWPRVAYLDVTLTSDRLREVTVVDTPGLASTNRAVSDSSHRWATGDGDDVGAAEAVLHVFTQAVRADDVAALRAYGSGGDPVTALGVFSKVDKLVAGADDPWPVAGPLVAGQADELRQVVTGVVPVIGLLAETSQAGLLTAADCAALRTLAGLPEGSRRLLLASADLFVTRDVPVPAGQRRRLLRLLDLYGVGFAVDRLAADPRLGSADLVGLLADTSGVQRLRRTVDEGVRRRADLLKAGWAVDGLHRLAGRSVDGGDRRVLTDAVEELFADEGLHLLRVVQAARQVDSGAVDLPAPMRRELSRLAWSTDPRWILDAPSAGGDELAAMALAVAARWRGFAVTVASPAQARVAHTGHRGFHLLAQRVRASAVAR